MFPINLPLSPLQKIIGVNQSTKSFMLETSALFIGTTFNSSFLNSEFPQFLIHVVLHRIQ